MDTTIANFKICKRSESTAEQVDLPASFYQLGHLARPDHNRSVRAARLLGAYVLLFCMSCTHPEP